MMKFQTNIVKVNYPLEVRRGIQYYMGLNKPVEISDEIKAAVIYKALQRSISASLGFYDGKRHDYSKSALKAINQVRRLVLGWLILPDEAVFCPLSSVDRRVTPQAVNGLSHWISERRGNDFVRRPAFFDELLQVIYCAQKDYETTKVSLLEDRKILFAECLLKWETQQDLFESSDSNMVHFWIKDFRKNYVEARGPELLAQHAAVYAAHLLSGKVSKRDAFPVVLDDFGSSEKREILEPELESAVTSGCRLSDYFD